MSPLAKVKENFLFNANRGWFLPDSEPDTGLFSVGERGGPLGYREAAVLCLLSYHQGQVQILLTKRSSGISFQDFMNRVTITLEVVTDGNLKQMTESHQLAISGPRGRSVICYANIARDACLPGGSKDSSDTSLSDTALREAAEEVGLDQLQVEVICTLPPQLASARGVTLVTPVVALTKCTPEELNLSPNPAEVDCLYWVPLEVFLDLAFDREDTRIWWLKAVFNYVDPETNRAHVIYGLTAIVCIAIAATALNRRPNYPYAPKNVSKLVKKGLGDLIEVTLSDIAVTREEAAQIPLQTGPAQMPRSKL